MFLSKEEKLGNGIVFVLTIFNSRNYRNHEQKEKESFDYYNDLYQSTKIYQENFFFSSLMQIKVLFSFAST